MTKTSDKQAETDFFPHNTKFSPTDLVEMPFVSLRTGSVGFNSSISLPPPNPKIQAGQGGPTREVTQNDVLSGRGGRVNSHEGNVRFRLMVNAWKDRYTARSCKKVLKAHIAAHIVNQVRFLNPPGRFLQKNEETGEWWEIGDERARRKTGQALREGRCGKMSDVGKEGTRIQKYAFSERTMQTLENETLSFANMPAIGRYNETPFSSPNKGKRAASKMLLHEAGNSEANAERQKRQALIFSRHYWDAEPGAYADVYSQSCQRTSASQHYPHPSHLGFQDPKANSFTPQRNCIVEERSSFSSTETGKQNIPQKAVDTDVNETSDTSTFCSVPCDDLLASADAQVSEVENCYRAASPFTWGSPLEQVAREWPEPSHSNFVFNTIP